MGQIMGHCQMINGKKFSDMYMFMYMHNIIITIIFFTSICSKILVSLEINVKILSSFTSL